MISRRIFSGFLVVFLTAFPSARAEMSFHSYRDAVELARVQDRMVYVLFGGDHCPWCHKQKDLLLKAAVVEALSEYIVCYVDVSEERDIADRYRIRSIPASVVLDSKERVVKKEVGYMDEVKFLKWLR